MLFQSWAILQIAVPPLDPGSLEQRRAKHITTRTLISNRKAGFTHFPFIQPFDQEDWAPVKNLLQVK
jgi:hypothetical protein